MRADRTTRERTSEPRVLLGLLSFALGLLLLCAGGLQRHDGKLSWGGRNDSSRTLARAENPRLFDRVTWGLIGTGTLLVVGGLGLAYLSSGRGGPR